jgi:hypothetical protein
VDDDREFLEDMLATIITLKSCCGHLERAITSRLEDMPPLPRPCVDERPLTLIQGGSVG